MRLTHIARASHPGLMAAAGGYRGRADARGTSFIFAGGFRDLTRGLATWCLTVDVVADGGDAFDAPLYAVMKSRRSCRAAGPVIIATFSAVCGEGSCGR
ncbi:hypothetical protein KCP74_25245 [Salmonella enterica subsp. enterica]|nr:hypothetical protein KCP74_25245 [Salmonella enterica subsp. enterica]